MQGQGTSNPHASPPSPMHPWCQRCPGLKPPAWGRDWRPGPVSRGHSKVVSEPAQTRPGQGHSLQGGVSCAQLPSPRRYRQPEPQLPEMLRADHPWGQKPPPVSLPKEQAEEQAQDERAGGQGLSMGSGVGWRHQSHGSGAWPWAMMVEEAGLPSSQPPPPGPAALQWEAGQTA